jgi:hypothetical protein
LGSALLDELIFRFWIFCTEYILKSASLDEERNLNEVNMKLKNKSF